MKKNKFLKKLNSRSLITALLCMMTFSAFAQTKTVKGTVTDDTGIPVIGATIVVAGETSRGTVTNFDGNYELSNVPVNASLVFSYVGYKSQTIAVKGSGPINVVLASDAENLDEVVVVGYGKPADKK